MKQLTAAQHLHASSQSCMLSEPAAVHVTSDDHCDEVLKESWDLSRLPKAYITIAIRLRYDYDEKLMFIFCLRRIGSRRARYVVVGSWSYRMS